MTLNRSYQLLTQRLEQRLYNLTVVDAAMAEPPFPYSGLSEDAPDSTRVTIISTGRRSTAGPR